IYRFAMKYPYPSPVTLSHLSQLFRKELPGFWKLPTPIVQYRCSSSEAVTTVSHLSTENTAEVLQKKKRRDVPCPANSKMMKVAFIGVPNAGKSTIINSLTNFEVCPVSKRPHTTRNNQKAVYLDAATQLVFVDTPGLVSVKEIRKFSFTEEFAYGPEKSIGTSNLIAVMHDVSHVQSREKLDFRIKGLLQKFPDKKAILIMNKIDTVKSKRLLLDAVKYLTSGVVGGQPLPFLEFEKQKQSHLRLNPEAILSKAKMRKDQKDLRDANSSVVDLAAQRCFSEDEIIKGLHEQGWPYFNDIFMVSALEGDGIDMLRQYMILNAVPHNWLYDEDTLTDVPPEKLTLKIVAAKLLEHLPQEVPFKVKPEIEYWGDSGSDSGVLKVIIKVKCPKERYKWIIIGTNGALVQKIANDTSRALNGLLKRPVDVAINPVFDKVLASTDKRTS
ncbi:GTPase Era, mitochondrial, partial [Orchesella cincta]